MSHEIPPDTPPLESPLHSLEQSLIDEFLRARGLDRRKLADLPQAERDAVLKEASIHASSKLSEVEARSHFVERLHQGHPGAAKAGLE